MPSHCSWKAISKSTLQDSSSRARPSCRFHRATAAHKAQWYTTSRHQWGVVPTAKAPAICAWLVLVEPEKVPGKTVLRWAKSLVLFGFSQRSTLARDHLGNVVPTVSFLQHFKNPHWLQKIKVYFDALRCRTALTSAKFFLPAKLQRTGLRLILSHCYVFLFARHMCINVKTTNLDIRQIFLWIGLFDALFHLNSFLSSCWLGF